MNKMRALVDQWENNARIKRTVKDVTVQLTSRDVAGILALQELYPALTEEQIITDIISSALNEIEEALPYVKGSRVIMEDEFGDPVYEDIGNSSRFRDLSSEIMQVLEEEAKDTKDTEKTPTD